MEFSAGYCWSLPLYRWGFFLSPQVSQSIPRRRVSRPPVSGRRDLGFLQFLRNRGPDPRTQALLVSGLLSGHPDLPVVLFPFFPGLHRPGKTPLNPEHYFPCGVTRSRICAGSYQRSPQPHLDRHNLSDRVVARRVRPRTHVLGPRVCFRPQPSARPGLHWDFSLRR